MKNSLEHRMCSERTGGKGPGTDDSCAEREGPEKSPPEAPMETVWDEEEWT